MDPPKLDSRKSPDSSFSSSSLGLISTPRSPAGVDRLTSFGDRSELTSTAVGSGISVSNNNSSSGIVTEHERDRTRNSDDEDSAYSDGYYSKDFSSEKESNGYTSNSPLTSSSAPSSPNYQAGISSRSMSLSMMSQDFRRDKGEVEHFGDRQNAFFLAALEGSSSLVRQYLESEPDLVNSADKDGQTALTIASGAERFDVVRLLHLAGARVCQRDHAGATPFYRAASKNDVQIMEYLLNARADLDASCKNGFTPLIISSLAGHLDAVKFLHSSGANMEKSESNGLTPFLVACAGSGNLEVVRYLQEIANCDIGKAEKNGCTPFILAAGAGHLDVCQYLLDGGADIDAQSDSGFTATFSAASSGNMEIIEFLHDNGADIEKRSNKGSTPLYIAAVHGHLDVVSYLHSVGGDVEAADNNGLTALHAAVGAGGSSIKVFAFLINCGCDITKRDVNGSKPLDYARRDPLHMLISIIASIWHESPFHKACYEDDANSLRVLLEEEGRAGTHYFSLNCVGRDAWTPLHVASFFNRVECARLLLEAGANTQATTFSRQQTALMISCRKNNVEIVRLISRYENNSLRSSLVHRKRHR